MQYQGHLQNHGPAILHDARLTVVHAGGRAPPQARQEAGPTKMQDDREDIQGSQALGKERTKRFWIRVRLMVAELVACYAQSQILDLALQ